MKENRLPYNTNAGYGVPEGYFEGLEARILAKVSETPSQGLPQKAKQPFSVPEGYLEGFEEKLMARIETQRRPGKLVSLLQRESFYYAAGVAAVFIAIVTNFLFAQNEPLSLDDLDMITLESYLEEAMGDPSQEAARLYSEGLYSFAPTGVTELNQEAVIEYLQENLEDPSVILNEN